MASDKTNRLLKQIKSGQPSIPIVTPIADGMVLPNHSGNKRDPVYEQDLATKKYVDDSISGVSGFLVDNANDTTTGVLTMAGGLITGDASSADTAYVPMVLYNTDATPPAASGFPVGTLYVQYTA